VAVAAVATVVQVKLEDPVAAAQVPSVEDRELLGKEIRVEQDLRLQPVVVVEVAHRRQESEVQPAKAATVAHL
jgi:hypothetical protein